MDGGGNRLEGGGWTEVPSMSGSLEKKGGATDILK